MSGEPISAVFHKFEADVDLTTAASELGLRRDQLLAQLGRLDPALATLEGSTVTRDVFKAKFANAVCLLRIGLANDAACRGASSTTGGGVATATCASAFSSSSCGTFKTGQRVSRNGHNFVCANSNCNNCRVTSCAPGGSGCQLGDVWIDEGACR